MWPTGGTEKHLHRDNIFIYTVIISSTSENLVTELIDTKVWLSYCTYCTYMNKPGENLAFGPTAAAHDAQESVDHHRQPVGTG